MTYEEYIKKAIKGSLTLKPDEKDPEVSIDLELSWIDPSERPPAGVQVAVLVDDMGEYVPGIGYIDEDKDYWVAMSDGWMFYDILGWFPLPQIPGK